MFLKKGGYKTSLLAFVLLFVAAGTGIALQPKVGAEGTAQLNEAQGLNTATVVFADVTTTTETIHISSCVTTTINIWNTNDTPSNTADDTKVVNNQAFTANLSCSTSLPNPITTAYKYTPGAVGTYRITLTGGTISRWDFSVTANSSTNPDPNTASGRIWSYNWQISTGSFALSAATDADLYVLVPASSAGENFVWKLDLNRFSGNAYQLQANSIGLNPPYSGLSATTAASSITPEFPIYIGYPAVAGSSNTSTPTISGQTFVDDANEDSIFSPGSTPGVQDTGYFKFTSNVNNANYAVTIDTNKDGVYGVGDRLLLGKAVLGLNSVLWDGNYPNGSPVPAGVYSAKIQIRMGEYHFIAQDVETSGGLVTGTWSNGLTIYRSTGPTTTENTTVYWDDMTELSGQDYPTANVPNGVTSGSLVDADSNGRADGYHTWGKFDGNGLGNNNNIDTYVYGPQDAQITTMAVATSETGDADGVPAATEIGAPNNGDGNNDATVDYLQDKVASLPNPNNANAYNTIASSGCTSLSNVSIVAESSLSSQDTYDYPAGLHSFQVNCASPGDTTTMTIVLDQVYVTTGWTLRSYNGTAYTTISGVSYGTLNVGGVNRTTISFSVADGGAYDADGLSNGTIVVTAGPGFVPPQLSVNYVDDDTDNVVAPGQVVHYTLTINNTGLSAATLPAVPIFVDADFGTPSNFTASHCSSPSGLFTAPTSYSISGIVVNANDVCTIGFDVTVDAPLANGTTLTSTADVSQANEGGNDPALVAANTLTVLAEPNLSTSTVAVSDQNGATLQPGDVVRYTINVINSGTTNGSLIHIEDLLPLHLEGVGNISFSNCGSPTDIISATKFEVTDVAVIVGTPCVITFDTTVAMSAPGGASVVNSVTIHAADEGGLGANPSAPAIVVDAPVADSDGVGAVVEAAGPNSGDSNNDGVSDSIQSNVTSLVNPITNTYAVLQNDSNCQNTGVNQVMASTTGQVDGAYQYPAGLMNFTLVCGTPGLTTEVTQYYFGVNAANIVARKYSTRTHSYSFIADAVVTNVMIGGQRAVKITYHITDGGALDDDGVVNGQIVDPSGPAVLAAVTAPNTGLDKQQTLTQLVALVLGVGALIALGFRRAIPRQGLRRG